MANLWFCQEGADAGRRVLPVNVIGVSNETTAAESVVPAGMPYRNGQEYYNPNKAADLAATLAKAIADVPAGFSMAQESDEVTNILSHRKSTDSECGLGKTRVLCLSGACILEISHDEASKLNVKELREMVSERRDCPPDYCKLSVGECSLEDICKLSDLVSNGEVLEISAIFEFIEPGPFALGQEAHWGSWENMSTNSEQLFRFDGFWELIINSNISTVLAVPVCPGGWPPLRLLEISEGNVIAQNTYTFNLKVCPTGVFLQGGRLEVDGDILRRTTASGTHRYKRMPVIVKPKFPSDAISDIL
jgi:hypothetical protein